MSSSERVNNFKLCVATQLFSLSLFISEIRFKCGKKWNKVKLISDGNKYTMKGRRNKLYARAKLMSVLLIIVYIYTSVQKPNATGNLMFLRCSHTLFHFFFYRSSLHRLMPILLFQLVSHHIKCSIYEAQSLCIVAFVFITLCVFLSRYFVISTNDLDQ